MSVSMQARNGIGINFGLILYALLFAVAAHSAQALPQGRIVAGSDTHVQHFPHIISLRGATGKHTCGGSIVAASWVLTAAHCVAGKQASGLSVQYGVTEIAARGSNVVAVKRIIMHEAFINFYPYPNDIALLELAERLSFNGVTVAPVQLPAAYYEVPQTQTGSQSEAHLAGWGRNETNGVTQAVLQSVTLKVYSDLACYKSHAAVTNEQQICAGIVDGGKGQCTGDSGGPLTSVNERTQLGIVSWSEKPCATPGYPGVFTKVSHYIDWLASYIDASELQLGVTPQHNFKLGRLTCQLS